MNRTLDARLRRIEAADAGAAPGLVVLRGTEHEMLAQSDHARAAGNLLDNDIVVKLVASTASTFQPYRVDASGRRNIAVREQPL